MNIALTMFGNCYSCSFLFKFVLFLFLFVLGFVLFFVFFRGFLGGVVLLDFVLFLCCCVLCVFCCCFFLGGYGLLVGNIWYKLYNNCTLDPELFILVQGHVQVRLVS